MDAETHNTPLRSVAHVEVRLRSTSVAHVSEIETAVRAFLDKIPLVECESDLRGWQQNEFLAEHVDRIYVAEADEPGIKTVSPANGKLEFHTYQPCPCLLYTSDAADE